MARDRKVGFAHRVLSACRISEFTEGSSQQILKADFRHTADPGDWSVPKAMLKLGSFWYASFKYSRE
jgi:hypothetical protein